jgi:hypothetical protein
MRKKMWILKFRLKLAIPPKSKEKRKADGQRPKAIEKLDLSVLPETQSNDMVGERG